MKKIFGANARQKHPKPIAAGSAGSLQAEGLLAPVNDKDDLVLIDVPSPPPSRQTPPLTSSHSQHQYNAAYNNSAAHPYTAPPSATTPTHPQHRPGYRERIPQVQDRVKRGSYAHSSSDEPVGWEVVRQDSDLASSTNLHASHTSSLTSLPPGASPPAPAPPPAVITPSSLSAAPVDGNSARLRRKKPASVKDSPVPPPSGAAAAILRTLDPHRRPISDKASTQSSTRSDLLESPDDAFFPSVSERDSIEKDRERMWMERDREIREAKTGEDGKKWNKHRLLLPDLGVGNKSDKDSSKDSPRPKDRVPGEHDKKSQWAGFFSGATKSDKDRDREKANKDRHKGDRERDRIESQEEQLTRMIGYLTATSSDNWSLILDVCERVSASESNAKVAAKALRREFKYAAPTAQLSAARLWSIMLRNASPLFYAQTNTRKFIDTLEDVISNPRTMPAVRDKLLEVVGAAVYATTKESGKDGFRSLWKKYKTDDKPDEGVPLVIEDDNSFAASPRHIPQYPNNRGRSFEIDEAISFAPTPPNHPHTIIPPDEDMRRLAQECKIGRGNAALLSEALAAAKPEDLDDRTIIKEFYGKCCASQELVMSQIPWATAGAERSRAQRENTGTRRRTDTREELLLADLLRANEELTEALRMYKDIERIGVEREVENAIFQEIVRSTPEPPPPPVLSPIPRRLANHDNPPRSYSPSKHSSDYSHAPTVNGTHSPSSFNQRSVSPYDNPSSHGHEPTTTAHSSYNSSHTQLPSSLAPPIRVPLGPRSPIPPTRSRSPSPVRSLNETDSRSHSRNSSAGAIVGDLTQTMIHHLKLRDEDVGYRSNDSADWPNPHGPSEKALGKRKVLVEEEPPTDNTAYPNGSNPFEADEWENNSNGEFLASVYQRWHTPQHYVYDAAAERAREWMKEGKQASLITSVK